MIPESSESQFQVEIGPQGYLMVNRQLEVSGPSGKAQLFGERCTNEWNPK